MQYLYLRGDFIPVCAIVPCEMVAGLDLSAEPIFLAKRAVTGGDLFFAHILTILAISSFRPNISSMIRYWQCDTAGELSLCLASAVAARRGVRPHFFPGCSTLAHERTRHTGEHRSTASSLSDSVEGIPHGARLGLESLWGSYHLTRRRPDCAPIAWN